MVLCIINSILATSAIKRIAIDQSDTYYKECNVYINATIMPGWNVLLKRLEGKTHTIYLNRSDPEVSPCKR